VARTGLFHLPLVPFEMRVVPFAAMPDLERREGLMSCRYGSCRGWRGSGSEGSMCDRCNEIDGQIARYSRLSKAITDRPTIASFNATIVELESKKSALHPKPDK
jgi:hypothetical protein